MEGLFPTSATRSRSLLPQPTYVFFLCYCCISQTTFLPQPTMDGMILLPTMDGMLPSYVL